MDPFRELAGRSRVFLARRALQFLGRDLEDEAILCQGTVCQGQSNPRRRQFTSVDATVAREEAAVAVLERAAVGRALGAARASRCADNGGRLAAIARRRLEAKVVGAVAARVCLADKERARDVACVGQVNRHDAVLVELRASDGLRLGNPTLGIARRRAIGRLDRAEAKRGAFRHAAVGRLGDGNVLDECALFEHKR